ncbi:hypothetical protein GC197_00265 [bacterium]|nr:hypothetical protein [bacterium]
MKPSRELMLKFIEDRESLSETELETLLDQLRVHPELAVDLKDQLGVQDLLEQKFDITRLHFLLQVEQRLRDETDEADDEPSSLSELGSRLKFEPYYQPKSQRSLWPLAISALVILGFVGLAFQIHFSQQNNLALATLESTEGDVHVIRNERELPRGITLTLKPGDVLHTLPDSHANLRYPDGTTVHIQANTTIRIDTKPSNLEQKLITLQHGQLSADVAHQPAGKPMMFHSPDATAEILGTKLSLRVEDGETRLKVTEGRVRFTKSKTGESVVIASGEIGVSDQKSLTKAPESWPSNRQGLIFLYETNDRANQVLSIVNGVKRSYTVRPRGRARLNHDAAMVLDGGAFLADDVDGEILAACQQTNQLSVEATIIPSIAKQTGPARIVTFSTDISQRDFTLGQEDNKLIVRIRTPQTGKNGIGETEGGVPVATLSPGEANHVIVSYAPGRLVCYLNGKKVYTGSPIQGDFRVWSAQHLLFGDEYGGKRDWAGTLEGIAIYNRFIEEDEAAKNAMQYRDRRQSRDSIPQARVVAKLLERSEIPNAMAIFPHRSALVVCKYQVEKSLFGPSLPSEIYVAHWALLDGQQQPIASQAIGTQTELLLEPLEKNPQVRHYFISDDFGSPDKSDSPRFLEVQR